MKHDLTAQSRGRGFTILELVTVIGIMTLVILMSLPLFNAMSGNHSIEAAQNVVSAFLQRARSAAIGAQDRRGVLFYDDPVTGKSVMTMVVVDAAMMSTSPLYLGVDLDNPDIEPLPQGIGAAFTEPTTTANTTYRPYGMVIFDGLGRVELRNDLRFTATTAPPLDLYPRCGFRITANRNSHAVLGLYDRKALLARGAITAGTTSTPPAFSTTNHVPWLDENATYFAISRYNGTLRKAD